VVSKSSAIQKSRKIRKSKLKDNMIYLEGRVVQSLPGVRFVVEVKRPNLEPLHLLCNTRTFFKTKNIKIIIGDQVVVELDPNDLTQGTIIERK